LRTTLDLPEQLVVKAMKLSRSKSKTAAITLALEELIRKIQIQGLKKFRGKIELDINLDSLRKRP